jgi:lipoprotein-anchoring transpeptidase ErfK/SrfK
VAAAFTTREATTDRITEPMHTRDGITIEKSLLYNQHTLENTFPYEGGTRSFRFDKMRDRLFTLDSIQQGSVRWGVLQNRKNWNGMPPNVKEFTTNEYHAVADRYGVERRQSAPLYAIGEYGSQPPERYGRDGSLVKLLGHNADSTAWRVESFNAPGHWEVPHKYVKPISTTRFDKVVMVDRTNQDIATLERAPVQGRHAGSTVAGEHWLIRSMNPCTTGAHQPPHAFPTPVGMFVIQDQTPKMMYNNGGPVIVGFAPWASRFTNGAFLHGVPVNNPSGAIVEYLSTLGTIPRSHECVRNASSHAKFIYDWAPLNASIVFVYD